MKDNVHSLDGMAERRLILQISFNNFRRARQPRAVARASDEDTDSSDLMTETVDEV